MDNQNISPLMPKLALEYFNDGSANSRLYLRATSIRSCLESIVETIFIHIIEDEKNKNWRELSLYRKLNHLDGFFPKEINDQLHSIRIIGNKGAHPSKHKELLEEEINITLDNLSKICEWTILAYFKKNGFVKHPWVPTVFSTLPPIYRIRILEEFFVQNGFDKSEVLASPESVKLSHHQLINGQFEFNSQIKLGEFQLLIDKLAMAYLKNRERMKSIDFINNMHNEGFINSLFKEQMLDKLDALWKEIDNLPISASLENTRDNLNRILPEVKKEEESLFLTLFTAITLQSS